MPPPPPKASAPAPPKAKAPPPPPGGSTKKSSKSSAKPKKQNRSQNDGDSTYDLGVAAASSAGAAAKAALFSFGSKVKKDVKSFTKSELENAGVDTNKPIIKKKPGQKKPAPAPSELQSYNVDWKKKNENTKPKKKPNPPKKKETKSKNNNSGISKSKSKSTTKSKSKPKPKPPSNNKTKNDKNAGISGRLAMFEEKDKKAGKTGKASKKDKKNSNGFLSKSKNKNKPPPPPKDAKKEDKNLKPSLVKKGKKNSPKLPAKEAPPSELKAVNVDWKAQREKMANVFKKKDGDKESKVKVKSKELMGTMKKLKASVSADSVDPSKPPPKKMNMKNMNIFKKNEEDTKDKTQKMAPPPPPADVLSKKKKAKSYSPNSSPFSSPFSSKKKAPPIPPDFDLTEVNKKIAKPEDYNEIKFKAVDPMELRRQQKSQGVGRIGPRTTKTVMNKPTSANNLANNEEVKKKPAATVSMIPPPVPKDAIKNNTVKKKKPALPSAPPPKPKPKPRRGGIQKKGVLEVMPTAISEGWVYTSQGMFSVPSRDFGQLKSRKVHEGSPVIFETLDKSATNIRLGTVDDVMVKECFADKKGKRTKYDAKFYILDTIFEFNGNLSTNAFEIPDNCAAPQIAAMSEKIVNAFINTDGGILYIGIDKGMMIKGVASNQIDLSRIKQSVMNLVSQFQPALNDEDLKKFKFNTIAVITKDAEVKEDLIVVRITVPGPFKDDHNDKIVFANSKGDKFKKNLNYIMKVVM